MSSQLQTRVDVVIDEQRDFRSWHFASFHGPVELGCYPGIADSDKPPIW
jgi:hypothetical protein